MKYTIEFELPDNDAKETSCRILESKSNGIMNLVAQAWAEGKRNAEAETLISVIDEALNRREQDVEPVSNAIYPTWYEYLSDYYRAAFGDLHVIGRQPIPANIAQKLGIKPKEDDDEQTERR